MRKHGRGWLIDGGGFYPEIVFRVRNTTTGELQRITVNYNNPYLGTDGEALTWCAAHKDLLYRLVIEKVEILKFKPAEEA